MLKQILFGTTILIANSAASAENFMDAKWAETACDAWNKNTTLTGELSGNAWIANNKGRGYKIIQMYRTECGEKTKVQLNIADKDGKAMCVYGGLPDGKKIDTSIDYIMHAKDQRWTELGNTEYGPMKAMMFGRLKFKGPKAEAMSVMGPFGVFLELAGSIPGEKGKENCPVMPETPATQEKP